MGRPFGTERSPTDSFSRHVQRQTESGTPVERLERKPGPGGRRRARQEAETRGQRSRVGPRPEERRAERQGQDQLSRRAAETQRREQTSRRQAGETAARSRSGRSDGIATREDPAPEFRARLAQQGRSAPDDPSASLRRSEPAGSSEPLAAVPPGPPPTLGSGARVFTPAPGGAPAVASGVGSGASSSSLLPGAGGESRSEAAKIEEPKQPDEATPTRWSRSVEAERAAQVLRQFRLQLHPGLHSATINLSPAELGRISIRLNVKDGRVSAVVRAETEETLGVLQRHLPELEASFAQQELQLDELDIGLGFSAGKDGSPKGSGSDSGTGSPAERDASLDVHLDPTRLARALAREVGVDTYA